MSHEIRTPMTAILGFADLLDSDAEHGDGLISRTDEIHTIKSNGNHLLQVLNDILDLSKVEAGELQTESVACNPFEIVASVESLLNVRAVEKSLQLQTAYVTKIPAVIHSDPVRIRQILFNLVSNAIKFSSQGTVLVLVGVNDHNGSESPVLEFQIADSGIGMPSELLEGLFQPFRQADSSTTRKFGGTGLGLATSKRLAMMLGGEIFVWSRVGWGSVFRLSIPTGSLEGVQLLEESPTTHADAPPPAESQTLLTGVKALLVEDGSSNRKLISLFLRRAGADVVVVENGKLAIDRIESGPQDGTEFDVVLMDMQMPVMDGYEATRRLRNKGYELPIVALTANASAADREKCLRSGCSEFVSKPIDRERLLKVVADLAVERRRGENHEKDRSREAQAITTPG
jgi:CheY-like chemotaxis protein